MEKSVSGEGNVEEGVMNLPYIPLHTILTKLFDEDPGPLRNAALTCRLWRQVAFEVLLADTAGSAHSHRMTNMNHGFYTVPGQAGEIVEPGTDAHHEFRAAARMLCAVGGNATTKQGAPPPHFFGPHPACVGGSKRLRCWQKYPTEALRPPPPNWKFRHAGAMHSDGDEDEEDEVAQPPRGPLHQLMEPRPTRRKAVDADACMSPPINVTTNRRVAGDAQPTGQLIGGSSSALPGGFGLMRGSGASRAQARLERDQAYGTEGRVSALRQLDGGAADVASSGCLATQSVGVGLGGKASLRQEAEVYSSDGGVGACIQPALLSGGRGVAAAAGGAGQGGQPVNLLAPCRQLAPTEGRRGMAEPSAFSQRKHDMLAGQGRLCAPQTHAEQDKGEVRSNREVQSLAAARPSRRKQALAQGGVGSVVGSAARDQERRRLGHPLRALGPEQHVARHWHPAAAQQPMARVYIEEDEMPDAQAPAHLTASTVLPHQGTFIGDNASAYSHQPSQGRASRPASFQGRGRAHDGRGPARRHVGATHVGAAASQAAAATSVCIDLAAESSDAEAPCSSHEDNALAGLPRHHALLGTLHDVVTTCSGQEDNGRDPVPPAWLPMVQEEFSDSGGPAKAMAAHAPMLINRIPPDLSHAQGQHALLDSSQRTFEPPPPFEEHDIEVLSDAHQPIGSSDPPQTLLDAYHLHQQAGSLGRARMLSDAGQPVDFNDPIRTHSVAIMRGHERVVSDVQQPVGSTIGVSDVQQPVGSTIGVAEEVAVPPSAALSDARKPPVPCVSTASAGEPGEPVGPAPNTASWVHGCVSSTGGGNAPQHQSHSTASVSAIS